MRKTVLLLSLLALFALPALAEQPATTEVAPDGVTTAEVAAAPAEAPLFDEQAQPAISTDCADAEDVFVLDGSTSWHCPFGAPRCFEDDHCDAYCGDPRFGFCFSNGCCGCTG